MSIHGTVTGCSGGDFFFILVVASDSSSRWITLALFNQSHRDRSCQFPRKMGHFRSIGVRQNSPLYRSSDLVHGRYYHRLPRCLACGINHSRSQASLVAALAATMSWDRSENPGTWLYLCVSRDLGPSFTAGICPSRHRSQFADLPQRTHSYSRSSLGGSASDADGTSISADRSDPPSTTTPR